MSQIGAAVHITFNREDIIPATVASSFSQSLRKKYLFFCSHAGSLFPFA